MLTKFIVTASILVGTGAGAEAIIIRHDVDDEEHLGLASSLEGLVHLNLPDGEGVLIASEWVLTAAHVAVEVEPGDSLTVVGSGGYEVADVLVHPDWDEGPNDLALIRLRDAVHDVSPAIPYSGEAEVGMLVYVVGAGDHGTGRTGPVGNDGRIRAATNRVDSANDYWLSWEFDDPSQPGSRATPLEGISGPGDSGGPALLEHEGARYVVGISSGQSTRATGGREGLYGVIEFYTRVSRYSDWIAETMNRSLASRRENARRRTPSEMRAPSR